MPKIRYQDGGFQQKTLQMIATIEQLCNEYARANLDLTLRALYYRLVARDLIPHERKWRRTETGQWVRDPNGTTNAQPNYDWLGEITAKARLCGLIDWNHLMDRTRNLERPPHWDDPADIIEASASSFRLDKWTGDQRVEVWVEKDALVGIIGTAARAEDVSHFSCRGYTSLSEMWSAGQRLARYVRAGQRVTILHFGDHDPSGVDMTRDIDDRLHMFAELGSRDDWLQIKRVALTMNQIEQYNPPPNPAKLTDSRANGYIERFGDESWELDALDPADLDRLVRDAVRELRDEDAYNSRWELERDYREQLRSASDRWDELVGVLNGEDD